MIRFFTKHLRDSYWIFLLIAEKVSVQFFCLDSNPNMLLQLSK